MNRCVYNKLRKIAFDNPDFTDPAVSWGTALDRKPEPVKPKPVKSYPDAADMIRYTKNSPKLRAKIKGDFYDRRDAAAFANRVGLPQFGVPFKAGWYPDYGDPKLMTRMNDNANKLFTIDNFVNIFRPDEAAISSAAGGNPYANTVSARDLVNFNPKGSDPVLNTYKLYNHDGPTTTLPVFKQLQESRMKNRAELRGESYDPSKVYPISMRDITGAQWRRYLRSSPSFSVNDPVVYAVPSNRTALGSRTSSYAASPATGRYGFLDADYISWRPGPEATTVALHEGITPIGGHVGSDDNANWGTADPDTRVVLSSGYGDVNTANKWFRDHLRSYYPDTAASESILTDKASKRLRPHYGIFDRWRANKMQRRVLDEHNLAVKTGKWQPETFLGYGNSLAELGTYGNNIRNIAAIRDGVILDQFDKDYTKDQTTQSGLLNYMVSNGFWKDNWADPTFDKNSGYRFSPGNWFFYAPNQPKSPGELNSDIGRSTRATVDLGDEDMRGIINHYYYLKNLGDRRTGDQTEEMQRIENILTRGMKTW